MFGREPDLQKMGQKCRSPSEKYQHFDSISDNFAT